MGFTATGTSNKISPRFYSPHKLQFPVEAASEICSTCLHSDIIVREVFGCDIFARKWEGFSRDFLKAFCGFDVPYQADWKLLLQWQFLFFSARFKFESCRTNHPKRICLNEFPDLTSSGAMVAYQIVATRSMHDPCF